MSLAYIEAAFTQRKNEIISYHAKELRSKLKGNIRTMNVLDTRETLKSLRTRTRKSYGQIDRIRVSFAKQGLFMVQGTSKGHPINNPRKKKDFYNEVAAAQVALLADDLAAVGGDAFINSIQL